MDRIQIDVMDFSTNAHGPYKWVMQIKDHFSHYIWLEALQSKRAASVTAVMYRFSKYNDYPQIL